MWHLFDETGAVLLRANQGDPGPMSAPWPVILSDGTEPITSPFKVQGAAADDSIEVFNPVVIGGYDNGAVRTAIFSPEGGLSVAEPLTGSDAVANNNLAAIVSSDSGVGGPRVLQQAGYVFDPFNPTLWKRMRGDELGVYVSGADHWGDAISGDIKPVMVGGYDENGNAQIISVDSNGYISMGYSGPVTSPASPNVFDNVISPVNGVDGTQGVLGVGVFAMNDANQAEMITGNAIDGLNVKATNISNDLFGRIRMSCPETLHESTFLYDKLPLLWDELTATGGTGTLNANEAGVDMAVTSSSGSRVVRQTKEYFMYQPGKAHQFAATLLFGTAKANCNQFVGMFDDNNGVYFELKGTDFGVGIRSKTTGSVVDTFVNKTDFNIDKLDGTGPSGMTIDLTKNQLLYIEYQWFGVGTVRWGLYFAGKLYYVHQINHSNTITSVYMQRGDLPIRYEIVNSAGTSGATTMRQICCSVDSEAGYALSGIKRSASNGDTAVTVGTTLVPVISIRLKAAYNRASVVPHTFSLLGNGPDNFRYVVLLNATLTGASFSSVGSDSAVEFDVAATALTGGTALAEGYQSLQLRSVLSESVNSLLKLVADIAGTTDILTIAAQHIGAGSVPVLGAMEWREYK